MKKNITPKLVHNYVEKSEEKVVAPSEQTLNFLKQFARSHYVENTLPNSINSFCVN